MLMGFTETVCSYLIVWVAALVVAALHVLYTHKFCNVLLTSSEHINVFFQFIVHYKKKNGCCFDLATSMLYLRL